MNVLFTEQSPGYSQTGRIGRTIEEPREFLEARHVAHFAAAETLEAVVERWYPRRPARSGRDPRGRIRRVRLAGVVRRRVFRWRVFRRPAIFSPHSTALGLSAGKNVRPMNSCSSLTRRYEAGKVRTLLRGRNAVTFFWKGARFFDASRLILTRWKYFTRLPRGNIDLASRSRAGRERSTGGNRT